MVNPAQARALRKLATRIAETETRLEALRTERNALLSALRAEGVSARTLAELSGLSHVGVMKVVEGS